MKKKLLLCIAIFLFIACCTKLSQAQNVNIPDSVFKTVLLANPGINTNSDAEISEVEASAYTGSISVSSMGINDLTGIEAFTAISDLDCSYNSLIALNVSANTNLNSLYCYENSISILDVSANIHLVQLDCSGNQLTDLNVSNNTALEYLYLSSNSIAILDVSANIHLFELDCSGNQLTDLDVSLNTSLYSFYCNNNSLISLNVKNGSNINISSDFSATDNPALSCIQVDDATWSSNNWLNKDAGASYSTDCSCLINIPDANFKNALLAIPGIDVNTDGFIQCSEAAAYTGTIDVSSRNIHNLTGIEAFSQILALNCMDNHLTTLDLSGFTSLVDLMCMNNQLTTLNLTACTNLYNLMCMNNQLLSLNVSGCTSLSFLDCTDNQLTTLDVSSCTNLSSLLCPNNQLTKLNASNGNNLFWFSALDNSSLYCIQVYDAVYADNNLTDKDTWASYSEDCHYCTNPTDAGEIEANITAVCIGNAGVEFSNTILPSGESGTLEYQWQTSLDGVNFSDLAVGSYSSTAYIPVALTDTTYFRRLSRVSCMTDWTAAVASNVVKISVMPLPNTPVLGAITQPNCINVSGSVELTGLPPGNWTINPGANAGSSLSATIYNLPTGTNNLTVTDENGCTSLPTADITIDAQPELPTLQATSLSVSAISAHTMTINWTRGSGDGVVVVARYGSDVSTDPQGGTIYSADAGFGMGDQIENGNFVVYSGTDTSVNVTGLTALTSYYFAVYEYKSSTNCYLVPALTGSATTTYFYTAGSIDNTNDYITNVTLGSINHASLNGVNGYEDFTSESTPLGIGDSISTTISFNASNPPSQLLIWVDWNHDGDFEDAYENVYVSNSSVVSSHTTASFSAPTAAVLGATRMRIRLQNSTNGPNNTSCGNSDLGEVEDYTITLYNSNVDAGSDQTICLHDSAQLQAIGGLIYNWTPVEGLNNPNIANPLASPLLTTKYYLNANAQGPNLIVNGDFSSGNTGFTSAYTYSNSNNSESFYTVTPSPFWWHNLFSGCGDHTTGNGNMMVMNGSFSNNTVIWSETITVKPHTNYAFSSWVASVHPAAPAVLQFSVNDSLLGTSFNASSTCCDWERFYQVWNSGNESTAEIKIVNQNIEYFGNDFALDDIYFSEMEAIADSMVVTVLDLPSTPVVDIISQPTCLQSKGNVSLSGLPSIGNWVVNPGNINSSGTTLLITNLSAGTYSFTVTNANGCTSIPSDNVVIDPQPVQLPPAITIISQPSCSQATGDITLSGLPDPWILSQNPGSITNGSGNNTTLTNLTTGVYHFTVTNSEGCVSLASVAVIKPQPMIGPIAGQTYPCFGSNQTYVNTTRFSDWFLPSRDELALMYTNLHQYSLGDFLTDNVYWSSSDSLNTPWTFNFLNGEQNFNNKSYAYYVRPVRSFVSSTSYQLRDTGPAGGLVFFKDGNTYLECAAVNSDPDSWHDNSYPWACDSSAITAAQGFLVGTGEANTLAIIKSCIDNNSAAYACKNHSKFLNTNLVWTFPADWTINSGQGSHTVNVTVGADIGTVSIDQSIYCNSIQNSLDVTPSYVPNQPSVITGPITSCEGSTQNYTVTDLATEFNDWFLPSKGELTLMYTNLKQYGVGGFASDPTNYFYWSSSDLIYSADNQGHPWVMNFNTGEYGFGDKWFTYNIRAARTFDSSAIYNLRDRGPAGGFIFHIVDLGGGNYSYYECSPYENTPAYFSWCRDLILDAQDTIVGSGASNTQAILNTVCGAGFPAAEVCSQFQIVDFTLEWALPTDWSILSGQGSNTVSVYVGAAPGFVSVAKLNGCGSGISSALAVSPNAKPIPPVNGIITQPSCTLTTGSIELTDLPAANWTLNPGAITGSSLTTSISGLNPGIYSYTITDTNGCISNASSDATIDIQPVQSPPVVGNVTQPSCLLPTASIELTDLPNGSWIINPGAITGSGTTAIISGLTEGIYSYSVSNADGCISIASADININALPVQSPPVIGTIIQTSCLISTGSIELTDLPGGNWTINPGAISGSTSSVSFSNLASGTYTYTVTNADGCTSLASSDAIIDVQPVQLPPVVGTIVQPSCFEATGSVELTNLPGGNWTINPGAITASGSTITISNLAAGTYTYTVTNEDGCFSVQSADINIQTQPLIPNAPLAATSQSFCDNANISNLIATGNSVKWYDAINSVTVLDSSTALVDANHYFASQTINGCESNDRLDVNVTIHPNPTVNTGAALPDICQGATSVALGGSFGGSATSAIWDDGGAGGTFIGNDGLSPDAAIYTALPTASSSILLTLTTSGGNCGIISAIKSLSVNQASVGGSLSGLNSITYGSSTGTLTLNAYTGNIQKWQKKHGTGSWIDINNTISTYSEIPDSAGTWYYRAEVKSGICSAANSSELSIVVNKKALSITADNKTKNFDGLLFSGPYTVSYNGFRTGENLSALSGSLNFSGTAITAITIGNNYTIIPGGITSANYSISYFNGTLTINNSCNAVVINNQNSGTGSLREAIANVCNNGTITFVSGLNNQTITLTSGTLTIDKNIFLNDSNLTNGFTISGNGDNITINSGKSLTLVSGSKITVTGGIRNNAGNTGLIIASAASFIHNTIDLSATVQRYLNTYWHLFGSPFKKNAGAALANITAVGGNTQMKPFTNGSNWGTNITSAIYPLLPTVGYAIKPNIPFTAILSGNLYYSPMVFDYTNSLVYNGTSASQSWNLLANPYTCYLDWNLLGKTNVNATLYFWDNTLYPNSTPVANTSYLRAYNPCINVGVPEGTSRFIAPLQGFFVKAVYTNPKLTFPPAARTHASAPYYKDASNTAILVRLKAATEAGTDELVICKNQDAKSDFEPFDSEKMFSDLPLQIYSQSTTGEHLIINTINTADNKSIPLGIIGNLGAKARITAFAMETAEQLYLEDRLKGKMISLSEGTTYDFEFPTDVITGRFFIRFGNMNTPLTTSDVKVFVNDNVLNIIAQTGENIEQVEMFTITGARVYKSDAVSNILAVKLDLTAGVYLVRVKTNIGVQNVKVNWR